MNEVKPMKSEHDYLVLEIEAPLSTVLTLFLPNTDFTLSFPEFKGGYPKVADKAVSLPSHPNRLFPLSSILASELKGKYELYEHMLLQSRTTLQERISVLPLGTLCSITVSGLRGAWERLYEGVKNVGEYRECLAPYGCLRSAPVPHGPILPLEYGYS